MPTYRSGEQTLFYRDTSETSDSSRPVLLLVHNLLADHRIFDPLVPLVRDRYRVLLPDLRGHGLSRGTHAPFLVEELAEDLHAMMLHANVRRANVLGVSLGATTAMLFASKHEAMVDRLVLCSATSERSSWKDTLQNQTLASVLRMLGPRDWIARRATKLLFGPSTHTTQPEIPRTWTERIRTLDPEDVYRAVHCWNTRPDVVPLLRRITQPTLVMTGDEDVATPPSHGERIAQLVRQGVFHEVRQCGHSMPSEQPEAIAEALTRWM